MTFGIFQYGALDLTGEAQAAAERMEARAREPVSEAMFAQLVKPLLHAGVRRVLEVGCGTGALARRIAQHASTEGRQVHVYATDKSRGMIDVANALAPDGGAGESPITFAVWDVNHEDAWPFGGEPFDLIVSSVMVPYLDDAQTASLVNRIAKRLAVGGTLTFVEQDLMSDSVYFTDFDLARRVFDKETRPMKSILGLGLRKLIKHAGLSLLPRTSFLWADDAYGPYTRDLLARLARDAVKAGTITEAEYAKWLSGLQDLADADQFYYGLVYHRVGGARIC